MTNVQPSFLSMKANLRRRRCALNLGAFARAFQVLSLFGQEVSNWESGCNRITHSATLYLHPLTLCIGQAHTSSIFSLSSVPMDRPSLKS